MSRRPGPARARAEPGRGSPSAAATPSTASGEAIRLHVCGQPDRGDDGLGWAAVGPLLAALPRQVLERVTVRCEPELRVDDLLDLPAGSSVIIVDAVAGVDPGSIVRIPLSDLGAPSVAGRARPIAHSSHQLPLEIVLGLGEALLGRPVEGVFLGLGAASFALGAPLSDAVRAALPALRAAVADEVAALVCRPVGARRASPEVIAPFG
jgi:hydrogenase maturation protease